MGGFFGRARTSSTGASAVARLGSRLAYASPAGGAVAAAPVGFTAAVGRLLVTLSADTTWISLTAGVDGQFLEIKIVAGNFTLTLPQTVFNGIGDLALGLNNGVLLYYDTTQGEWEVTSP